MPLPPTPPRWRALRPWQRHSLVLAVAGVVYVTLGLLYLFVPLTPDRLRSLHVALSVSGGSVRPWGSVWILVGLLALVSTRWPPASKTWGYTGLSTVAGLWGSFYWLGVTTDTQAVNLTAAIVWYLVGFLWWAISGLVNPDDVYGR